MRKSPSNFQLRIYKPSKELKGIYNLSEDFKKWNNNGCII